MGPKLRMTGCEVVEGQEVEKACRGVEASRGVSCLRRAVGGEGWEAVHQL